MGKKSKKAVEAPGETIASLTRGDVLALARNIAKISMTFPVKGVDVDSGLQGHAKGLVVEALMLLRAKIQRDLSAGKYPSSDQAGADIFLIDAMLEES
jgi:hypothetical protein